MRKHNVLIFEILKKAAWPGKLSEKFDIFKDSVAPIAPVLVAEIEAVANATVGPGVVVDDGFKEGGNRAVYEGWRDMSDTGDTHTN